LRPSGLIASENPLEKARKRDLAVSRDGRNVYAIGVELVVFPAYVTEPVLRHTALGQCPRDGAPRDGVPAAVPFRAEHVLGVVVNRPSVA